MGMSIKSKYSVSSIDSFQCREWIVYKHYAHRVPPVSYAFGLFDSAKILQGVCTYGVPLSSTLKTAICGEENAEKVFELNRLVINEGHQKNTLSYFVAQTLKLLPRPMVVVSYSDTSQGHHGYIYQACNFLYTGLSAEFQDYAVEGMEHLHNATVFEKTKRGSKGRVEQLRAKYGDKLYFKQRDRKHRYVTFLGTKLQIKKLKSKLKYPIEKYPKGDNKRYDASYQPHVQQILF